MKFDKNHWLISRPIAHRGLYGEGVPENSLLAFKEAIKNNYPIELDIQLTKDDKLVVFHDYNLLRLTGLDRPVIDCTLKEIQSLRIKGSENSIPTLTQALKEISGKVPVLIEIKSKNSQGKIEPMVLSEIKKYKGEVAVQSFHPLTVRWFRKNSPDVVAGYISGPMRGENMNKFIKFLLANLIFVPLISPKFVAYDIRGSRRIIFRLFKKFYKKPIITWTINNQKNLDQARLCSDNIIFENIRIN